MLITELQRCCEVDFGTFRQSRARRLSPFFPVFSEAKPADESGNNLRQEARMQISPKCQI